MESLRELTSDGRNSALPIVWNVMVLFILETLLQNLYYTVEIKYLDTYASFSSFGEVFKNKIMVFGVGKLIFILPVYVLYYLMIARYEDTEFLLSLRHSLIFMGMFFIIGLFLPGELIRHIMDTIFLSLIVFVTAYYYLKYTSFKHKLF